ncbi:MAG: chain length determinant protein EpsF [Azoarcus sp.]|nr:chain length determinant protein EpsF [Azoarcus sp.]
MTFQQFLLILWARKWVVWGVLASVVIIVLIVSLILPKQYTATTALVIDLKASDPVAIGGGMAAAAQLSPGYLATQVDIIESERVAQRVVELTGMERIPVLQEQWREETNGEVSFQSWMALLLQKQLDVRPSRESSVINIRYSGLDPAFAAAVANTFARAYIETTIGLKVDPARQYAQWFDEQTKDLRDKLQRAQSTLSEYEQTHGVLAGDGRFDIENQHLVELNSQLAAAQGQRADSGARQSEISSAESLPEVMANGLISSLKADLARSEAQRSQLLGKLGENHPQVLELSEEIAELRRRVEMETQRVANSLGTSSRVSTARVAEISAAIEKQKARVLELKAHNDQLAVLQRDIESAQKAYDFVMQSFTQKTLESQTQQANISVLTPAEPPLEHSSPRLLLNMVIAVFLGSLLGVGMALVLELVDQRVRGSEDLSQFVGIPVLGIIPAPTDRSGIRIRRRPAIA